MRLTDDFGVILRKVTQDLHSHTGKSKFYPESGTIVTYSQGQVLSAEFAQMTSAGCAKFSYVITLDKADGYSVVGPFEYDDAEKCASHIYGLIISKLGDKVMKSLLN